MIQPRLRVALPAAICENGDTLAEFRESYDDLLSEWAAMLDPVGALRQEYWLAAPWALAGWVGVSDPAIQLLRQASRDGALVQIFADSLEHHSLVEGNRLSESAMPLLLGNANGAEGRRGAKPRPPRAARAGRRLAPGLRRPDAGGRRGLPQHAAAERRL
jgi:hypothetical protein